jgi:hypothetical protein
MSDTGFLKCSCQKCGGHLEFPSSRSGEVIDCPHCNEKTMLVADISGSATPSEKSPAKLKRRSPIAVGSILVVFILIAAGAMFYRSKIQNLTSIPSPNAATSAQTNPVIPDAVPKFNDFDIGQITLKKVEGSGLVYAVGTLRNKTDRQRFGVRVQMDVLDEQDTKIGSASDYIAVLEPRKDWQFRAMLTETKGVKVKLTSIEEQK